MQWISDLWRWRFSHGSRGGKVDVVMINDYCTVCLKTWMLAASRSLGQRPEKRHCFQNEGLDISVNTYLWSKR